MQVRKVALVVCLLVGMAVAATAKLPHRIQRGGKIDDGVIETILELFGLTLNGQFSIPPG